MILLLEALIYPILKHLHDRTHYRKDAIMVLIRSHLKDPHFTGPFIRLSKPVRCAKNNPKTEHVTEKGVKYKQIYQLLVKMAA